MVKSNNSMIVFQTLQLAKCRLKRILLRHKPTPMNCFTCESFRKISPVGGSYPSANAKKLEVLKKKELCCQKLFFAFFLNFFFAKSALEEHYDRFHLYMSSHKCDCLSICMMIAKRNLSDWSRIIQSNLQEILIQQRIECRPNINFLRDIYSWLIAS